MALASTWYTIADVRRRQEVRNVLLWSVGEHPSSVFFPIHIEDGNYFHAHGRISAGFGNRGLKTHLVQKTQST